MNDRINRESGKSSEQLEREINDKRAHLTDTLAALEEKFSPGQIFDQVLSYGKENGGQFSQQLVDSVKYNPVPAILTAVGIGWLMMGQNRPQPSYRDGLGYRDSRYDAYGSGSALADNDYASDFDEPTNASYGVDPAYDPAFRAGSAGSYSGDQYTDDTYRENLYGSNDALRGTSSDSGFDQSGSRSESTIDSLKAKTAELKGDATRKIHEAQDSLHRSHDNARARGQDARYRAGQSLQHSRDSLHDSAEALRYRASRAGESARYQARRASEGFDNLLREQPLAIGAVGIALGAVIGALLPATRREDELMGGRRDQLAGVAAKRTHELYEDAKETGARVADEAKRGYQNTDVQGAASKPH